MEGRPEQECRRQDLRAASLEPFANLAYVNLSSQNFTETGSAAALTGVGRDREHALFDAGRPGGDGVRTLERGGSDAACEPRWQHAFGDVNSSASLAFVSGGSAFTVAGVPIARDAALVGAGVDYAFSKSVSASVTYSGQFGSGTRTTPSRAPSTSSSDRGRGATWGLSGCRGVGLGGGADVGGAS